MGLLSPYSPFPFSDFGGLDLTSDADESSCIDCLNVDFDKRGSVRSRDGVSKFNAVASTSTLLGSTTWEISVTASKFVVALGVDAKLRAWNSTGTLITTSADLTANAPVTLSAASLGTASTGPFLYIACNDASIARFDGSAFTQPSGMPGARFLTTMPTDNRLVAAGVVALPSGSTAAGSSGSLVHIADAGAPQTWTGSSWEVLTPNDGENISGAVTFANQTIIFKESRFFVFYGNSTDADGGPVFNYRTVDAGVGALNPDTTRHNTVCVAEDGAYFVSRRGVYVTTGGPPRKISDALDPLFEGTGSPFFQSSDYIDFGAGKGCASISRHGPRVLVTLYLHSAGWTTFAYYRQTGEWSVWQPAQAMKFIGGVLATGTGQKLVWVPPSSTTIYVCDPAATTDDGTAITSRYRSGFTPLNWIRRSGRWYAIGSQEATVRESVIDGTGTIKFSVSRDFGAVPTTGGGAKATVALGTSPAVAQGRHTITQQGRRVSYQIEDDGTGSAWRVYDLTMHIEDARYPGVETS